MCYQLFTKFRQSLLEVTLQATINLGSYSSLHQRDNERLHKKDDFLHFHEIGEKQLNSGFQPLVRISHFLCVFSLPYSTIQSCLYFPMFTVYFVRHMYSCINYSLSFCPFISHSKVHPYIINIHDNDILWCHAFIS